MSGIPASLHKELIGWGFDNRNVFGVHRVTDDGSELVYEREGDVYILANSTYYGEDTDPHRPFLAVVLDVLAWAATQPVEKKKR